MGWVRGLGNRGTRCFGGWGKRVRDLDLCGFGV